MLALVIVLSTLLSVAVTCDPDNPTHCAASIKKGEVSPINGQVLTSDLAITLGQKAEKHEKLLEASVLYEQKKAKADLDLAKKVHEIDVQAQLVQTEYWETRAKQAEKQSFFSKPPFVIALSVVTTIALFKVAQESIKVGQ